jgi:hypothetical protein
VVERRVAPSPTTRQEAIMQTRTKPQQTSRIGRRTTPAPQGRFKRHAAPKPSTGDKAMSALSGVLGGGAATKKGAKKSGGGGRAGKMALLAGGVGLAMKNRGKLMGMLNQRSANRSAAAAAQPSPPPPPPGA